MKDPAEAQIARGFLPVIGVLGSLLTTYLYVVRAPDPLGRLTPWGALVISLPMAVAWAARLLMRPR